jgi:hypothetical protein
MSGRKMDIFSPVMRNVPQRKKTIRPLMGFKRSDFEKGKGAEYDALRLLFALTNLIN